MLQDVDAWWVEAGPEKAAASFDTPAPKARHYDLGVSVLAF